MNTKWAKREAREKKTAHLVSKNHFVPIIPSDLPDRKKDPNKKDTDIVLKRKKETETWGNRFQRVFELEKTKDRESFQAVKQEGQAGRKP